MIKPVYEAIAAEHAQVYGSKGARFVEVELGIGEGQRIAGNHGVSATPTFIFFRNGKKVDEMKGATKKELEGRVESFLEDTWPRHPHRKSFLPAVESVPITAITSTTAPNYAALLGKLESFGADASTVQMLKRDVVPLLEGKTTLSDTALRNTLVAWTGATTKIASALKPEETFPLIDLWRVGLMNPRITTTLALNLSPNSSSSNALDPLSPLLSFTASTLKSAGSSTPKPLLLTALRLLTNTLASFPLANLILTAETDKLSTMQEHLMSIAIESLLHPETGVRSAGAGVAINLASWRHRRAKETKTPAEDGLEVGWEVELVSALVESIARETDEDIGEFLAPIPVTRVELIVGAVHRLLAALALSLYLSPAYIESLAPLLEVLGAKSMLEKKGKVLKKKEVKRLADELAGKLCP